MPRAAFTLIRLRFGSLFFYNVVLQSFAGAFVFLSLFKMKS